MRDGADLETQRLNVRFNTLWLPAEKLTIRAPAFIR
ncbi:hypothetical protein DFP92_10994 [Yoonia sediminilitoris]|uniref:Uncharacterized protein n=1 Tax=Yoonia sediminilitoris TaxID=1286148 RepID=A0A2T6KCX1_9RHOB|nr:hypothetical protein C8N45_10994 [Yoonia sediminilitoris]RCW94264.1 hypothetical protein DFP92_10994 [Yoonia sediminilitoris]